MALPGQLRRVQFLVAFGLRAVAVLHVAKRRLAGGRIPLACSLSLRVGRLLREPFVEFGLFVDDDAAAHGEMRDAAQLFAQRIERTRAASA